MMITRILVGIIMPAKAIINKTINMERRNLGRRTVLGIKPTDNAL